MDAINEMAETTRRMHSMSLPHGVLALLMLLGAVGHSAAFAQSTDAPAPSEPQGESPSRPALGALGLQVKVGPEYPGARDAVARLQANWVVRWGRLTVSNGGPLASRLGEPAEAGLSADLFSLDRFRLSASVRLDQGRDSDAVSGLRGVHDIPAHLRGRLRAGWQLHRQWEISTTWRTDLSGRGTGKGMDLTLLHEWRPDFLDHTRWRVSVGTSAEWLDATRANLVHGVTEQDAARSGYAPFRLDSGWTEWALFANARRELGSGWLGYGSLTATRLLGQAANGPLVQHRQGLTVALGVGRRF